MKTQIHEEIINVVKYVQQSFPEMEFVFMLTMVAGISGFTYPQVVDEVNKEPFIFRNVR